MSLQEEDPEGAKEAWAEFFERHWTYLLGVCGRAHGASLGELGVQDLAADTLFRAYQKAHTFTPAAAGSPDYKRQRIRAWLGAIANRLFLLSWRRQPKIVYDEGPLLEVEDPKIPDDADCNPAEEPERMAILVRALATLTQREREILVASYEWYNDTQGCHRMPDSEVAALAAKYQTTAVNIRKIRSRAMEKVENYFKSGEESEAAGRNDARSQARLS